MEEPRGSRKDEARKRVGVQTKFPQQNRRVGCSPLAHSLHCNGNKWMLGKHEPGPQLLRAAHLVDQNIVLGGRMVARMTILDPSDKQDVQDHAARILSHM